MNRVVITGAGPVSAIGIGRDAFVASLRERRSGIAPVASFDPSPYPCRQAAEIRGFRVDDYLESAKNYLDRSSELAFAAMSLALEDANLDPKSPACLSAGLLLGTAYGSLATMGLFFGDFLQKGPRLVKPVLFPHTYSNTAISLLAIEYNLSGYHANFASGAIASAAALVEGYDRIRQGKDSLVFAGGFESFNEILFAGCGSACTPGEGAGIVVLEERERALARGAAIRGELVGAGLAGGLRVEAAMRAALAGAPFGADGLDLVLVNENGNADLDAREAAAVRALGAPRAAVESLKPLVGETFGAAGALQLIGALGRMETDPKVRRVLLNVIDSGGAVASLAVLGAGA